MTTQPTAPESSAIPEFHTGDRMAKALDHAGIGRGEMADYLGVSTETIRRWVTMTGPIKRAALLAWASVTGVSVEWLETGQAPTDSSGPDLKLPRLDSNQQPSGYPFSLVSGGAEVVHLAAERAWRRAS